MMTLIMISPLIYPWISPINPRTMLQESATSDFSPSSDGVTESIPEDAEQEDDDLHHHNDEHEDHADHDDVDSVHSVDSLDEGLGDISSENELSESPNPGINSKKV